MDDVIFTEQALFLPTEKTLVVSDLQLGQEQQLRKLGHNIKYQEGERMVRLLKRLVKKYSAERLVINGDIKHEFGRISGQERRDVLGLLRKLKKEVEIILVKGNHDTITKPLADEEHVPFVDSWESNGYLCVHGHELQEIPKGIHTIIIGHMHPAITLNDGVRREKFKCFLVGKYERKKLIVLPSFTQLTDGVNVLQTGSNTPFVTERSLQNCDVYLIADEIKYFGTVKKLKKMLD